MAEWEEAIIIGQLIIPFFLIYASKSISEKNKIFIPLKALLFIVSFFLIIHVPSTMISILDIDKDSTHPLTEDEYGNLTTKVTGSFAATSYLAYVVMAYSIVAFLYWLFILFKDVSTKKSKWDDELEGGGEF